MLKLKVSCQHIGFTSETIPDQMEGTNSGEHQLMGDTPIENWKKCIWEEITVKKTAFRLFIKFPLPFAFKTNGINKLQ